MKKLLLQILILIAVNNVIFAEIKTGSFKIQYDNAGVTSEIYCYVPEDYDSTKSYPFLWGWHGAGMPGWNIRDVLEIVFGSRYNAIICCPDANNLNGQPTKLLTNLANASYNFIIENYNINKDLIVITGFSWGGRIAYQLGLTNPQLVKGIVGLAPTISIAQVDDMMWSNISALKMATFIGDQDFNFENTNNVMQEIKFRGADLLYEVKPGVDHTDSAYANSQEFIDDYIKCYEYVLGLTSARQESEEITQNSIDLWPNPANEFVNIKIENLLHKSISVNLLTSDGAIVSTYQDNTRKEIVKLKIPINNLAQGSYMVLTRAGNNLYYNKFVK